MKKNSEMICSKDKKAFLEEIIPFIANPSKIPEIQDKLYKFLIHDTNGGKLYKYRCFDKEGYSVNGLLHQTLHCSKPTEFNDPFDCRLGITFSAFSEAVMNYTNFDLLHKGVEDCIRGAKSFEDCNEDEQTIVRLLLSNPAFVTLVDNLKRKKEKASVEEVSQYIKEITKITLGYYLKTKKGRIPKGLAKHIETIDFAKYLRLGHPPTIFDYLESTGFELKDGDEITNVREYFRENHVTNEEKLKAFDDTFSSLEQEVTEKLADTFRIGCLAGSPYNRLMWSHYGDSHRGFCIEYDAIDIIKKNVFVLPVYYSQSRPLVSWDPVVDPKSTTSLTATINAIWALLTKDQCWEYENEWRVLRPSQLPVDVEVPISAVYLGASITPENKETVMTIAKEHGIPVKQMKTDRGEYKLHSTDVLS